MFNNVLISSPCFFFRFSNSFSLVCNVDFFNSNSAVNELNLCREEISSSIALRLASILFLDLMLLSISALTESMSNVLLTSSILCLAALSACSRDFNLFPAASIYLKKKKKEKLK